MIKQPARGALPRAGNLLDFVFASAGVSATTIKKSKSEEI
jgi:hypothetical protein